MDYFERLAENSQQWNFNPESRGSSQLKKETHGFQSDVSLNVRLDSLILKVDALVLSQTIKVEIQVQQDVCSVCASPMHNAMVCPLGHQEGMSEQVNALN